MKKMQDFHKKISSKGTSLTAREHRLMALTRLSRSQVDSLASSDPWFIWSAGSAAVAG